jgi:hypothetical protein
VKYSHKTNRILCVCVDCVSSYRYLKSVVSFFWSSSYNDEHMNSVNPYAKQNKLGFIKLVNATEVEVDFSVWTV